MLEAELICGGLTAAFAGLMYLAPMCFPTETSLQQRLRLALKIFGGAVVVMATAGGFMAATVGVMNVLFG